MVIAADYEQFPSVPQIHNKLSFNWIKSPITELALNMEKLIGYLV